MMDLCPICKENPACSPHHIVPRAEGGTDNRKNIVHLCVSCHDIVEDVYQRTGMKYSPYVVRLIRLRYGFKDVDGALSEAPLTPARKKPKRVNLIVDEEKVRSIGATDVKVRCNLCLRYHYPNKRGFVVCPEVANPTILDWSINSRIVTSGSKKRLYVSRDGRVFTIKRDGLYHYPLGPMLTKTRSMQGFLNEFVDKVVLVQC